MCLGEVMTYPSDSAVAKAHLPYRFVAHNSLPRESRGCRWPHQHTTISSVFPQGVDFIYAGISRLKTLFAANAVQLGHRVAHLVQSRCLDADWTLGKGHLALSHVDIIFVLVLYFIV